MFEPRGGNFSWPVVGAAMFATLKLARKLHDRHPSYRIPDFGDKYLSTNLWSVGVIGWRWKSNNSPFRPDEDPGADQGKPIEQSREIDKTKAPPFVRGSSERKFPPYIHAYSGIHDRFISVLQAHF